MRPAGVSMAAAQIADNTEVASSATVSFDGGVRPPVAPTGTLSRLTDRWFCFVRAIDSSFSRTVAPLRRGGGHRHHRGCPALVAVAAADDASRVAGAAAPALPKYVERAGVG